MLLVNLGVLILIFTLVPANRNYSFGYTSEGERVFNRFMAKYSSHLWLFVASIILSIATYLIIDSRRRQK